MSSNRGESFLTQERLRRLTAGLLAFIAAVAVGANESLDAEGIAAKFSEAKRNIVDHDEQKRKILGSLYDINRRMKRISTEKSQLVDQLFQAKSSAQAVAKVIADLEKQIDGKRMRLKKRLKALYKLSGEGYLAIIFSQTSASDVDQALKYVKIITDNDYQLMRSYQVNVAELKVQREKLKKQVERLVAIERGIKAQEHLLVREHRSQTKIVNELDKSKLAYLFQLQGLRKRSEEIVVGDHSAIDDHKLANLLKPSFFEQKGRLPHPLTAPIVQDFGLITDDKYKIQISHKGWQYGAGSGTKVLAVFEGTVVHAGWIPGYGNTVVLDHGDHYYTLYSHASKLLVKVGDDVDKLDVIAEAGSTSRRFGDGIYFGIRHFSEPENPSHWVAGKNVKISSVSAKAKTRAQMSMAQPSDKGTSF